MTQRKALYGTTAVLLATAGIAQADVTASDVWSTMQGFYGSAGYEIQPGSVDDSGSKVTVSDLKISFPNPYADLTEEIAIDMFVTVPSMTLEDAGDGSVKIMMPDTYTMSMVITPQGEETGTFGLTFDQTGLTATASGDPDNVTISMAAPMVTAVVDQISIPGEDELAEAIDAKLTMADLAANYTLSSGAMPGINMDMSAGNVGMNIDVREPGGSGMLVANFDYSGIDWNSTSVLAQGDKPGDMTSMLRAGMNTEAEITHSGSTYSFKFVDGRDSFDMQGSASGGGAEVAMSDQGIRYQLSNSDMALRVAGSEIPLPEVTLNAAATAFGITMPVLAADTPQDLGLLLKLEGLAISDMIWGMIDPGGQLPRDPATLIVDLAGKANWFLDIMDPIAMTEFSGGLPGALHKLTVNDVTLALGGAELNAKGDFDIDMNNMSTFGGMPAPTGALDVNLSGVNGLMDTLVSMGLLPEEQAMGAKMMMGLFAQPGEGPDTLVSKIEVDGATGAVSANGQRLQ